MKSNLINAMVGVCIAGMLQACVSPEQQKENSRNSVERFFNNPADRQGINSVLQIDSYNGLIYWFPDEVSEKTVNQRVQKQCGGGGLEGKLGKTNLKSDRSRVVYFRGYDC